MCHLLIIQFQWSHIGAAVALDLVLLGDMLIQDFWISLYEETEFLHIWLPWSKSTFEGMSLYLEYSIPSAIHEFTFFFALELFVCISGLGIIIDADKTIEKSDFTAITVVMNIASMLIIVPMAMSYTASAFIGNY